MPRSCRSHRPLGENRHRFAVLERPPGLLERAAVASSALDADGVKAVHRPRDRTVTPELRHGEKTQITLDRTAKDERVEHRLVVRDHDQRAAGRNVLSTPDLQPVETARERPEGPAERRVGKSRKMHCSW